MTIEQLTKFKQSHTKQQVFRLSWRQCLADVVHLFITRGLIKPLFPKQKKILEGVLNSDGGFKLITVIRAGRRTSKSISTAIKIYALLYFGFLFDYNMQIVVGAPDTEDTRHVWRYLNLFWRVCPLDELFECRLVYNNYLSKSSNKKKWSFDNDSEIITGAGNEPEMDDFRGEGVDFITFDEFGSCKYKEYLLQAVQYSLKDANRLNMADYIGSPDVVGNGAEFNALFKAGQQEGSKNVVSYHLKGADNPYTDKRGAETAKEIVSENAYRKEELGEAVPQFGQLFPEYKAKTQTKKVIYNKEKIDYNIGLDFGMRKPYVCFYQYINDTVKVFYEISPKDVYINQLVTDMLAVVHSVCDGVMPALLGCDPAGDKENDVINKRSFDILKESFPMAQYTRKPRLVSKSNQVLLYKALMIKNRLEIDEECEMLLNSIAMATPDTNNLGAINSPGWKKVKGIDDPLDGLAYGMINFAPLADMLSPYEEPETMTTEQTIELVQLMG
jgi:hypothetical protein